MTRALYLVAYDVHDSRRLGRVCRCLKSYRVDGQKSVPEIWLTPPSCTPFAPACASSSTRLKTASSSSPWTPA